MKKYLHYKNSDITNGIRILIFGIISLLSFSVQGQTDFPEIEVKQGASGIASGGVYSFADQNVNTSSAAITFTIENSGSADLSILEVALSGDDADQFSLDQTTTALTIEPGTSTTFTVTFSPTTNVPEQKNAAITILSDDADEGTYVMNVTGAAVILPATITSVTPTLGTGVGNTATINGTNLSNTTAVTFFDGVPATSFTIVSNTRVTAVVPAGATTGPISVTNEAGTVLSAAFRIIPRVTSLSPNAGAVGSEVIITGFNFTGATSVRFNGTEATVNVNSDTQITTTVPANALTGRVTVTTPSGTSTGGPTFTQPPTITALSATSGAIGNEITITGTNFTAAAIVTFHNNVTATKTSVTPTEIKVTIPVSAATGPLTVTTVAGTVSTDFTVINTTYTWNNTNTSWINPTSWTPARTTPTNNDLLLFNTTSTVTLDFASAQTIGYLNIGNNATVTFTVAANKTLNIDNNVAAGADFIVGAGSSLIVTNSAPAGGSLIINITAGETGTVAGAVTFQGAVLAQHRLIANNSTTAGNTLVFQTGSAFTAGANFAGSPFGTTYANSVLFTSTLATSTATYTNASPTGGSPFGGANAVVVFDPFSTYIHQADTPPDLLNRTYGHVTVSNNTINQTIAGTGNLTIRGTLILTSPSTTATPVLNLNLIGTITINRNLGVNNRFTLNVNPAAAATLILDGRALSSRAVTLYGTGGTGGTLSLGPNATFVIETGAIVTTSRTVVGTGKVVINGTVRTNNVNGLTGGAATNFTNTLQSVAISAGSTVEYTTASSTQTISALDYANLTISGARSNRTVTLPALVRVSEAFSPTATNVVYNTAGNTFEFNGATQNIPTFPYNNLTVAGTGDKALTGNATVNGNLLMSANRLNTGANTLTLASTATITGEADGKYVVGNLSTTRDLTTSGSDFGGIGIAIGLGPLGPQDLGSTTVVRTSGPAGEVMVNDHTGINRRWEVLPTQQPTAPINVTLAWIAEDDNGKDLTTARVWQSNEAGKYADVSGTNQDATSHTITTTVNSLSTLTVSDQNNPLPVELISFAVTKAGQAAVLAWQTASEINNLGFAVEISADAKHFREVGFVKSKDANAKNIQSYEFRHRVSSVGTVYYRLKQTDWNGTTKYYGPKAIRFDQATANIVAYPNPMTSANQTVMVALSGVTNEKVLVTVTDNLGKTVHRRTELIGQIAKELPVDLKGQPAGIYLISITTAGGTTQTKVLKQ